jgi:hypothetical protein
VNALRTLVAAALLLIVLVTSDAAVARNGANPSGRPRDVVGADGIVYRYVGNYGYQFHPLANFARLNRTVSLGDRAMTRQLARSLLARAVHVRGGLVWEYRFPFGGPVPWRSGFVQAVAAQALARAAVLTDDPALERAARAALGTIGHGLSRPLAGGIWVREYSFSDLAILNAQLQSLVSLHDYVETTGDPRGRSLVRALRHAALALLREFDTGCWSRYSLGGAEASVHYHEYHVHLLRKLAAVDDSPVWKQMRDRWARLLDRRHVPCGARA